ncbi:hypothetical protein SEUCBS140593_008186 [Sporothrix eucalyptigena]|uniref:Alpha/beta hydrolase fold-3 domain-containing protein n=1 Tax=Sporothrix eucalyptigena TaxID=1812306 RepID=A0ABP0CJC7_9PEZI
MSSTNSGPSFSTEDPKAIKPFHPPFTWGETFVFGFGGYAMYTAGIIAHYGRKAKELFSLPEKRPNLIKAYPCRPSLNVHFFYPPSYDQAAGPAKQKLPTLLTIHGGGFVLGNPQDSDVWNHDFVRENAGQPTFVVALNYRKGPVSPFPVAIHDLEAITQAVLADTSLPIDLEQVALAGWSAGGNLALSLASLPSMQGRLRAVVPVYPVVDFSIQTPTKVLHRYYKPGMVGFRGNKVDFLSHFAPTFNWSYLPKGFKNEDLKTPLLSPTYLPKKSLPSYIFLMAAELDMLSHEAWEMACKLAGRAPPAQPQSGSSEEHPPNQLILDDERFAFEERTPTSSYKWLLVPDAVHAFDMNIVERYKSDDMYKDAQAKRRLCMTMIHDWLFSGPFKA